MSSPLSTRRRKLVLAYLAEHGPRTQFEIMAGVGEPHDPKNRSLYASFWESLKLLVKSGWIQKVSVPSLNQIQYKLTDLGRDQLSGSGEVRMDNPQVTSTLTLSRGNRGLVTCPNCQNKLKFVLPASPEDLAALSDEITRGETGDKYQCGGCRRDLSVLVQDYLETL